MKSIRFNIKQVIHNPKQYIKGTILIVIPFKPFTSVNIKKNLKCIQIKFRQSFVDQTFNVIPQTPQTRSSSVYVVRKYSQKNKERTIIKTVSLLVTSMFYYRISFVIYMDGEFTYIRRYQILVCKSSCYVPPSTTDGSRQDISYPVGTRTPCGNTSIQFVCSTREIDIYGRLKKKNKNF